MSNTQGYDTSSDSKELQTDAVRPYKQPYTSFGACRFTQPCDFRTTITRTDGNPLVIQSQSSINFVSDTDIIDCGGSTLTNVAGVVTDADDINIFSPYIATINSSSSSIFAYTTTTDAVYIGHVWVITKSVGGTARDYEFKYDIKIVNVAGITNVTVLRVQSSGSVTPTTLTCTPHCTGAVFSLAIVGETGFTMRWKAYMHVLRNN